MTALHVSPTDDNSDGSAVLIDWGAVDFADEEDDAEDLN